MNYGSYVNFASVAELCFKCIKQKFYPIFFWKYFTQFWSLGF